MPGYDGVVVGALVGGVDGLSTLVSMLPSDWPAAVFNILHVPAQSPSLLLEILSRQGQLPAKRPIKGEQIRRG